MARRLKKVLSLLLALSMILSMLSVSAFADEVGDTDGSAAVVVEEDGDGAGVLDAGEDSEFVDPADENETVDPEDSEEADVIDEPSEAEEPEEGEDAGMSVGPEEIGEIVDAELVGESEIEPMAAAAKKITVTYNFNLPDGTRKTATQTGANNTTSVVLQFPDYSCDGYELVRWATSDTTKGNSSDVAYQDGDTYTSSTYAGLTLYARWEQTASEDTAVAYVEAGEIGRYYDTLQSALDAAYDGNYYEGVETWKVTLLDDVTECVKMKALPWNGPMELTLDLNGHTLCGDGTGPVISAGKFSSMSYAVTFIINDSVGTGVVTGGNATYGGAVYVSNPGSRMTLVINGGTFTDNTATYGGAISSAYQQDVPVIINGGTFTGNHATEKGGAIYARTLTVTGGAIYGNTADVCGDDIIRTGFNGQLNLISADSMGIDGVDSWLVDAEDNRVTDDHREPYTTLTMGTYEYTTDTIALKAALLAGEAAPAPKGVAKVDETGEVYETLQEAVNAANDGNTVVLLADTEEMVTIEGKTLILDLNGNTLSYTGTGVNNKTQTALQLTKAADVTITGDGTIKATNCNYGTIRVPGGCTLTVESGTIIGSETATGRAIEVFGATESTVNIKGGSIKGSDTTGYGGIFAEDTTTVNISGGTVSGLFGVMLGGSTKANVTGGTIDGTYGLYLMNDTAAAEVSGGAIPGGVWFMYSHDLTVTGGHFGEGNDDVSKYVVDGYHVISCNHVEGCTSEVHEIKASYTNNGSTHTAKCVCGAALEDNVAHEYVDGKCVCGAMSVAMIQTGEVFGSLQEALDAVKAAYDLGNGEVEWTVTLLSDTTENVEFYAIPGSKNINDIKLTIDLHGNTITGTGDGSVITIGKYTSYSIYSTFIVDDTVGGGTITGGNADKGGAVYVEAPDSRLTLIINGGTFTGNTAKRGGAIFSTWQDPTTVIINGGTFTGNTAIGTGAVYGTGGAIHARTLQMNGGTITGNTANRGGGIYAYSTYIGSTKINGGQIYGNTAAEYGDDIVFGGATKTGTDSTKLLNAAEMDVDGVSDWLVDGYNLTETDRADAQQVVFDAGTISTKSGEIVALKAGELTDYLEVSVEANKLINKLGDTVTWTVTLTNKSGSDKQITLTNSLTGLGYKTLTPTLTDENGQTVSAVTVPGKGSVTLTASYTLPTSESTFVGKTMTYSVTAKGAGNKPSVTVKNAEAKTVKADLAGITVELITEENKDSVPANVSGNSKVSGVYYPASLDEQIAVGSGVTLLYRITVTGDPYAWYNLSYDGAAVVSGISRMSQLPASGEAVAYVTKTFTVPSTEGTLEYNPKVTTNSYTNICSPNNDLVVVNATSKAVTLGVSLAFQGDGATAWTYARSWSVKLAYTITDSEGNEVASVTDMYRSTGGTLNNCVGWESENNDLDSVFYYTFLLDENVLKADETYTITWKVDNYVYSLFDGFVYEDTLTSTVKTSELNEKGDIDAGSINGLWHSYKLNLCANDGTDTVESLYGTCRLEDTGYVNNKSYNFTIPEAVPARVGYVFQGWAKTSDAAKAEYQPGDTYAVTRLTSISAYEWNLYAVWALCDHVWEKIGEVETSCTTEGNILYSCTECGATTEVIISPVGHTIVIDEAVEPTCTEAGKTWGSHCSVCDAIIDAPEIIPANGHTRGEAVVENRVEPTCTENGSYDLVVYCTVCEDEVSREYAAISALGHEWAEAYTSDETSHWHVCVTCGAIDEAVAHTEETIPAVAPTYTETGLSEGVKCSVCDRVLVEQTTLPVVTMPVIPTMPSAPVTAPTTTAPTTPAPTTTPADSGIDINDTDVPLAGVILPFIDVANNAWYHDAIAYSYINELMMGVGETIFAPDDACDRATIATVIYRLEKNPEIGFSAIFTDVVNGMWYTNAIEWGAANSLILGYGDATFGTFDQVTREQLAALLYRYAQFKGYDVSASSSLDAFKDGAQVSDYAKNAMSWAVAVGLFQGDENGCLNPTASASRADIAMLLMRFIQNIVQKNTVL